jgi:hypothetical protein
VLITPHQGKSIKEQDAAMAKQFSSASDCPLVRNLNGQL